TTRELAKMIKEAAIDLPNLQDQDFDNPLGKSTGAASIFGASGVVPSTSILASLIPLRPLTLVKFTLSKVLLVIFSYEVRRAASK
ncbi:[Fe-Fe] hydrogenase large subunit C-terminal domain-containing protein, partial [Clostridioides difficile]|uniref:[Fe-Fe] hydrogenase large subunit C-terminal domain-containing protein n=1 Tax=Clostridioides difficile TaxID=1496 RepID=UPI003F8D1702